MIKRWNGRVLPQKFDSMEDFHANGFVLDSERQPLIVVQLWKEEMVKRGVSAVELARVTNSTRMAIYNYLDGISLPSLGTAMLICEALSLPFEKAFRLEGADELYCLCQLRRNSKSRLKTMYLDTKTLCVLEDTDLEKRADKDIWVFRLTGETVAPGMEGAGPRYEKIYYTIPRKGGGASTE